MVNKSAITWDDYAAVVDDRDELKARCEDLTTQNAALIRERDAYDARRRENMDSCEAWRQRCYDAEARLRALGEDVPE